MRENAVAVTALGAVTAHGVGVEALWNGNLRGLRPFDRIQTFGVEGCRVQIAAEVRVPVPALGNDRSAGLALLAVRDALGGGAVEGRMGRVGLIVGCSSAGTAILEQTLSEPAAAPSDWWIRYQKQWLVDRVAAAIEEEFQLDIGPRMAVNTACSSGAVAIGLGLDWLRAGDCDCALVIGTDELSRFTFSGFNALRSIDPEPCRPFDKNRRGLSMGEGAGCLVLERVKDAARRHVQVRGYVLAVGTSCDAYHFTAPDPEGIGAARAISLGLTEAGLSAEAIDFVNAHGTGTPLNDTAEVTSLEVALGAHAAQCPVHSVKSTIGHCMGAAGALEAIVALRSLETGIVPPTAGLLESEFEGRVRCVKGEPLAIRANYALSTSFGFGGNNAALVLAHA